MLVVSISQKALPLPKACKTCRKLQYLTADDQCEACNPGYVLNEVLGFQTNCRDQKVHSELFPFHLTSGCSGHVGFGLLPQTCHPEGKSVRDSIVRGRHWIQMQGMQGKVAKNCQRTVSICFGKLLLRLFATLFLVLRVGT